MEHRLKVSGLMNFLKRDREADDSGSSVQGLVPLRLAAGFGLWAGWLNLAVVWLIRHYDQTISMSWLRTNRHFIWMTPLSILAIFGLTGLLAVFASRWLKLRSRTPLWRFYATLAIGSLLLNVEGIYGIAVIVLAIGSGFRLGRWLESAVGRIKWTCQVATILGMVALGCLVGYECDRVVSEETRILASLPNPRTSAKNVLLIVLDNVRASSLSLYGRSRPTSPNLERLAKRGITFTQARSTSSWTLPSHASLMTGQWCHDLTFDFDRALDEEHATLAETLSAQGYSTAGFVANTFYGNTCYGLSRGFARYEDHYENQEISGFEVIRSSALGQRLLRGLGCPIRVEEAASIRKSADMINRDLTNWLDHRPTDRPFFAFLNYFDAHAPFVPPETASPRFGLAALPQAEQAEIVLREVRLKPDSTLNPAEIQRIREQATATRLDSYETCIASLDQRIGELFDELDRRHLTDDTVIILTSDHGEHFNERGYYGHGLSLYEPEIHVPLIVFPPSHEFAGRVVSTPVSLRDVSSTLLELAGDPGADRFPGHSLADRWRSTTPIADKEPLIAELGRRKDLVPTPLLPTSVGPLHALVVGQNVFIQNGDGREEHYHLGHDPSQKSNLVHKESARMSTESLRSMLQAVLRGDAGVEPDVAVERLAGDGPILR